MGLRMVGTIKIFPTDMEGKRKGYGFLNGEDDIDRFFSHFPIVHQDRNSTIWVKATVSSSSIWMAIVVLAQSMFLSGNYSRQWENERC